MHCDHLKVSSKHLFNADDNVSFDSDEEDDCAHDGTGVERGGLASFPVDSWEDTWDDSDSDAPASGQVWFRRKSSVTRFLVFLPEQDSLLLGLSALQKMTVKPSSSSAWQHGSLFWQQAATASSPDEYHCQFNSNRTWLL